MNAREIFEVWAPRDSFWSAWAKPSLFLHLAVTAEQSVEGHWNSLGSHRLPRSDARCGLVIDLPGPLSALVGLQMASEGYRPVPLYNCIRHVSEVIPTSRLRAVLDHGANDLAGMRIPPDAPPAFLLDSDRLTGARIATPGNFDNRWMVFPQDFPSATMLRAHGIESMIWVQERDRPMDVDLPHIMLRWQQAGITLLRYNRGQPDQAPNALTVPRPGWFSSFLQRSLAMVRLRRNSAGGFGGLIPDPGSGSGYSGFG